MKYACFRHGYTPLLLVVNFKSCIVAEFLIEQKVDINIQNFDGLNPLKSFIIYGHTDLIKALLKSGADVNAKDKGDAALFWVTTIN